MIKSPVTLIVCLLLLTIGTVYAQHTNHGLDNLNSNNDININDENAVRESHEEAEDSDIAPILMVISQFRTRHP